MSKCCCCIGVVTGATILGFIGILMATTELVPLVPYLLESDEFNPIKENIEQFYYIFQKMMEEHKYDKGEVDQIVETIKKHIWPVALGEAISAAVFALFAFLMVIGAQCNKRALMLPYMIFQMTLIVLFMLVGIGATIGFFFLNIIMGVVCGIVFLVISFLLIYFWVVVQRAYVDVGAYSTYTPASTSKHVYSHHQDYPSAPHQFNLDETIHMNGK